MANRDWNDDIRYKKAAKLSVCHALGVPKSMLAEKFSIQDAEDETKQQRVRRLALQMKKDGMKPLPSVVALVLEETPKRPRSLSPLTDSTHSGKNSLSTGKKSKSSSTASTASLTATPKKLEGVLAGVKMIRKTAKQAQQHILNEKIKEENNTAAFKEATTLYFQESSKPKTEKRSARIITEAINTKYGTNLSNRTVLDYVSKGWIGVFPKKRGPNAGRHGK